MKKNSKLFISLLLVLLNHNLLICQPNFTLLEESIITGELCWGGGWGDYDNDGYLDLFAGPNNIFHNLGDGTFDIIYDHGIEEEGRGLWIDFDNDDDLDISFMHDISTVYVYSNNGDVTFTEVPIDTTSNKAYGVAWADYDNNGYLDVFIGRNQDNVSVLYQSNGDGTFTLVEGLFGDDPACRGFWGDYNNDGNIDLFMTSYESENFFYHNNGDGTMTKIEGLNITNDWWSIGASWVDYNNDRFLDLFVFNLIENSLYTNNGDGTFSVVTNDPIVNIYSSSRSCAWGDYDNDGDKDLFVGNGYPSYNNNLLYTNNGDGTFINETNCTLTDVCSASGGKSWGDYDNDGDLDLAAFSSKVEAGMSHFFLNNGNGNNWINIKCTGILSNRSAIGAIVRVKAEIFGNDFWQMIQISAPTGRTGQNSLNAEFGLGDAAIIDTILVAWPSGITDILTNIDVNQFIDIYEEVSSEPYIIVSSDTLDFGVVYIGDTHSLSLTISNNGLEPLEVTNISCSDAEFTVDITNFTLNLGESQDVIVSFTPDETGNKEAILTIYSNDPVQSTYEVQLTGEGLLPPEISVIPDSMSQLLYSGKSAIQILTISNTGNSELFWEITLEETGYNTITFTKEDYADWTNPANQDCITPNVCITRANIQGIFNAHTEPGYNYGSPDDTEWAFGYTSELQPEDYQVWYDAIYGNPPGMVNQPMSIHLISDDIYFDILFHSWTAGGNGGGFSYTRTSILPEWLMVLQHSGIIPADSSNNIEVIFNAAYLEGGNYDGYIVITNNDPINPIVNVPVHLEVLDAPSIYTLKDTLDFGDQFIGYPDTLEIIIENTGSQDLLITSVGAQPDEYTVYPTFAGIDPNETETFTVIFLPENIGIYNGILTFSSNDPLWPEYVITLNGAGIEPPVISVSTDSLSVDILSGQTTNEPFTINNLGGSDLVFEIHPGDSNQNFALQFDGINDYVDCGNNNSLRGGPQGITIEAWIKPYSGCLGTGQQGTIIEKRNPTEVKGDWGLYLSDNSVTWRVYSTTNNPQGLIGTIDFDVDTWHHIAVVYIDSTGEKKIYVNGILDTEHFIQEGLISESVSTYSVFIAKNQQGDFEYFEGIIDEVRIWNSALTQEVIAQNLYSELLGTETGLAGYWKFNEGGGLLVYDNSSNENNGTIENGVTWTDITAPVSPFWLSVSQGSGNISANSSLDMDAIFNADYMNGGDYYATISILSNDPSTPVVDIPAHMHVTGAPSISTDTDIMEFGEVFINYTDSMFLEVMNVGSDELIINNAISEPEEFNISPSTANIEPGESFFFTVYFLPLISEEYSGSITLFNNDTLQNEYVVSLIGEGIEPPVILISPDSIYQQMEPGQTASQTINLNNSGGSELYFSIFPQSNYALEFDGLDDYCLIPNSTSLNIGTNKVTIELWVKLFELPSQISGGFAGIYDSYEDSYVIYEDKNNQELRFKITDDNGTAERPGISEQDLSLNVWYHVAGVYDGVAERAKIYLNGELKDSHENGSLDDEVKPDQIASFGSEAGISSFFNGIIDECRIWSVSRSQVEINEFMHERLTGSEPGLAAYWCFNEGTGSTAFDLTVNGNDGTLFGGTLWKGSGAPIYPDWLDLCPDTGYCSPGTSIEIQINFSSENLEAGNYFTDIVIFSNDPANPEIIIPVHLEVTEITSITNPDQLRPLTVFPNPFSNELIIKYYLQQNTNITLEIYDMHGKSIQVINQLKLQKGIHKLILDGSSLQPGIYFCTLKTNEGIQTRKIIKL